MSVGFFLNLKINKNWTKENYQFDNLVRNVTNKSKTGLPPSSNKQQILCSKEETERRTSSEKNKE